MTMMSEKQTSLATHCCNSISRAFFPLNKRHYIYYDLYTSVCTMYMIDDIIAIDVTWLLKDEKFDL